MLQKYKLPVSNHGTGSKFFRSLVGFSRYAMPFQRLAGNCSVFSSCVKTAGVLTFNAEVEAIRCILLSMDEEHQDLYDIVTY